MFLQPGEYAVTPSTRPRPCPGAGAEVCPSGRNVPPGHGRFPGREDGLSFLQPMRQVPESSRRFDRRSRTKPVA
jgi:hypothetical protein